MSAGGGWAAPERSAASVGGVPGHGAKQQQQQQQRHHDGLQGGEASGGSLVAEGRAHSTHSVLARLSLLSDALGSTAMYHVDTGLCDEHVPLNVHGYFLPFWQRFLLRGTYVAIITAVAIAMVRARRARLHTSAALPAVATLATLATRPPPPPPGLNPAAALFLQCGGAHW